MLITVILLLLTLLVALFVPARVSRALDQVAAAEQQEQPEPGLTAPGSPLPWNRTTPACRAGQLLLTQATATPVSPP